MIGRETISSRDLRPPRWAESLLWSISFLAVMGATATAIHAASQARSETPQRDGGTPAILIDFAPVPQAPAPIEESASSAEAEMGAPNDMEPVAGDEAPEPLPAEPDPAPEPEPEPELEPEPEPEPEIEVETPSPQEEQGDPATVEDDAEPEPSALLPPDPAAIETPHVEAELSLLQRIAIPQEIALLREQTPATPPPPPAPRPQASAPAARASAQAAPQPAQQSAAPAPSPAPPSPQISPQRWQSQLFAHLDRFKRYPAQAAQRRERGVVYMQFTINAGGTITSWRMVRSSGSASLDEGAAQMMRSASPVPPPPASVPTPATLTVPIEFSFR